MSNIKTDFNNQKKAQEELKNKFTSEELKEIQILNDPIKWSEKYLCDPMNPNKPLLLRWYQKEMLKSRKRKKVIRCGRRSGKTITLIVEILWKLYVRQYRKIVLITPYKSQIQEIWGVLAQMIENSPMIQKSIKRKVNNPHELDLYNGSTLKAFTAGSKSSSKGANIRSLSAHDIYLDEADYLGQSALEAIEPLLLTSPDTTLWASSTPTGRRETFYNWNINASRLGFASFHYPSHVSPVWISMKDAKKKGIPITESSEFYFRQKGESFYNHEILAEFGDEEEGVFKSTHLDNNIYDFNEDPEKATLEYYNPGYKQNKKNVYILGVDWNNSVNGTQLVLTEYLREPTKITYYENNDEKYIKKQEVVKNKYRLFFRCSISGKESTQIQSVNKIIELIGKFKIDHIYCDMGFGQTNIELLHEYGKKHPELKLDKKIVAIDFGKNIETINPLTKVLKKEPIKPYIIYTAVHEIENNNCILPVSEDDNGKLLSQMRSYTIKKHSQAGTPIFSQGNEHMLIAWLLSITGFHFEYSTLIKPELDPNDLNIARIKKSNILMPYLEKVERKTIKDNDNKISQLFTSIHSPQSIIPGNKITTDPGFYNDSERQNSYQKSNIINNPWGSEIQKINYFNINRKKIGRGSPTGRKLI